MSRCCRCGHSTSSTGSSLSGDPSSDTSSEEESSSGDDPSEGESKGPLCELCGVKYEDTPQTYQVTMTGWTGAAEPPPGVPHIDMLNGTFLLELFGCSEGLEEEGECCAWRYCLEGYRDPGCGSEDEGSEDYTFMCCIHLARVNGKFILTLPVQWSWPGAAGYPDYNRVFQYEIAGVIGCGSHTLDPSSVPNSGFDPSEAVSWPPDVEISPG